MKRIVLFLPLVALAGCVSTSDGPAVRVVNESSAVASCQRLQQFSSLSLWGGIAGVGYQDALTALQRQTASIGGNALHLISVSNMMGGTNMVGDAYRC